ncbi:AraC family transcriptional regulator [Tenacibaculum sp. MAR_2009_124]|uniref:GyrI-like domain-containing protein n=1 Tax=Tenacibaculum sp. MAR_2009_124 TaxID=1250059 RepID=UPI00089CBA5B|nr:GyrI-like domain-containing protein [Tenacibaculum sp. MAR_2009_124]SEC79131.1 AraC family transcriptional regulator [Tenacibaculum sp. MAR_2009_124]
MNQAKPQPRIEQLTEKKFIGQRIEMSLVNNKTHQLWSQFVPKINKIQNRISEDKISMQVYPPNYYKQFNPSNEFEKWAIVEVLNFDLIPNNMETYIIQEGTYAVFDYKGSSSNPSIFQYIFSEWIPNSPYVVDDRPHFEVLGENYKNNDPNSEEEIWIPIKAK